MSKTEIDVSNYAILTKKEQDEILTNQLKLRLNYSISKLNGSKYEKHLKDQLTEIEKNGVEAFVDNYFTLFYNEHKSNMITKFQWNSIIIPELLSTELSPNLYRKIGIKDSVHIPHNSKEYHSLIERKALMISAMRLSCLLYEDAYLDVMNHITKFLKSGYGLEELRVHSTNANIIEAKNTLSDLEIPIYNLYKEMLKDFSVFQ